jgi:hypothetical protein
LRHWIDSTLLYENKTFLFQVDTEKRKGCFYDKIEIYGGEDADAPKLFELCHSDKPMVYTSPGNKMFVKFHSDFSQAGRGFNASYRSVPIQCGGRFTANSGIVHSTNYPQNYPHAQDCEWLLEVDSNHLVNLTFLDFDIENSRNCTDDYVKVFHINRINYWNESPDIVTIYKELQNSNEYFLM